MILYRALTDEDLEEFKKTKKISCTLARTYCDLKNAKDIKMTKEMYDICYRQKNKKDILSFVYGHVSGKLVCSAKRSPWISMTSSFDAAYKYSNLQKCVETKDRRSIICFDVDDNLIINTTNDFKTKDITNGAIINLSDGKFAEYRKDGIIIPFRSLKNKQRIGDNFTLNNFSKGDKEFLICYELNPVNYILLTPIQQDELFVNYQDKVNDVIKYELENTKIKEKQLVKKLK